MTDAVGRMEREALLAEERDPLRAVVSELERHSDGDADAHADALPVRVSEAASDALAGAEGMNDAADDGLSVGLVEKQRDVEWVALARGVEVGQGETLLVRLLDAPKEPVEEGGRVKDTAGLAVCDGKRDTVGVVDHEGAALDNKKHDALTA